MTKKRNYTIQHNRKIVKCPKCKTSIIDGEKCLECEKDEIAKDMGEKLLKYPEDVSNGTLRIGMWENDCKTDKT